MKKNYNIFKAIVLLISMLTFPAAAQLSGVYTINKNAPGSVSNYTSFNTFRAALVIAGISGPVTVNVVANSGPYNEQVDFPQVAGTAAGSTITINGNGNTLTFAATTALPHTFNLSGMDYMTVNDLNITGSGATALACHLWSQSNNNSFNNCSFNTQAQSVLTSQYPLSISGSATSAQTAGNSGNNNVFTGCSVNWGYMSVVFYGNTAAPFNTGNQLINCAINDTYNYGIYNVYCQASLFKGNVVERTRHTNPTTFYGIMLNTGSLNCIVDGNRIRHPFAASPFNTSTAYMIYVQVSATAGNENIIKNNIVSDVNSNGGIYGLYIPSYTYNNLYNNTIYIDDQNSTYTGTTYAIYAYGNATNIRNNIVYVRRSGTGSKYGIYVATNTGVVSNYNNVYMPTLGGQSYYGYWGAARITLANMNTGGSDLNSKDLDPFFTNPALGNYTPNNSLINDMCVPTTPATLNDFYNATRNATTPDVGAVEFMNGACSGAPAANSVVSPTYVVCPGQPFTLGLTNGYTTSGISYTWQASTTTPLGGYSAIPGANQPGYTGTVNVTTYFTAIVGCGGGTIQAAAATVSIANTTINTIPYYEGFEGITGMNRLPNCSWASSNMNSTAFTFTNSYLNNRVPRTGTKFASFYYSPVVTSYVYTNGLQLVAGVTYSAGLWYTTDYSGTANWADLSLLVGSAQASTGLVPIASASPAVSGPYVSLGNIFTVPASGIYYIAIRATPATASGALFLSYDDLEVTIPCSAGVNSPTLTLSTSATSVCAGTPVTLSAGGATTYSWTNDGSTNPTLTETPLANTSYTVTGYNTISGCSTMMTQFVQVKSAPNVVIYSTSNLVCSGSPVNLTAGNAMNYAWSNGATANFVTVNPAATTLYSVTGVDANGCTGTAMITVSVNALPTISASGPGSPCKNEAFDLTATGAMSYVWQSNSAPLYQGNPVTVMLNGSTIFTVTGTDANGCAGKTTLTQSISECVGLKENTKGSVRIYPNPTSGEFTMELNTTAQKSVTVTDLAGRVVATSKSSAETVIVNINDLANGIYYVKIQSENSVEVIKVIKQ